MYFLIVGRLMKTGLFFAAIAICAVASAPAFAQQVDDLAICMIGWREASPEVYKMPHDDDAKAKACSDFLNSGRGSVKDREDAAIALGSNWERPEAIENVEEITFNLDGSVLRKTPGRKVNLADYDRAIAAYGMAIQIDPQNTNAYWRRALALRTARYLDRSIADYNEVVRLKPDDGRPLLERAGVFRAKGDLKSAISDYSDEIKLNPFFLDAYQLRGFAYFLDADYPAAIADYLKANKRPSADTSILLYIARGRNGEDGTEELKASADRVLAQLWPRQMIEFFLGTRPIAQLVKGEGAEVGFGNTQTSYHPTVKARCQSLFYLGEWYLIHKNSAKARAEFNEAVTSACPSVAKVFDGSGEWEPIQYDGAVAELKRLGQ
jgi:tetratricopeptide (TPR) repeat protein